jgi:polyribonucleotide nucleotidyltransferase
LAGGGGHRSDSQQRERQQPAGSTIVIRVPNGSVGKVIGKGGAKINELQDQTGAKIRVSCNSQLF